MTCPAHGTTSERFIPEEPPTHEHGPGGQAFYECEICGHQDFISREDLEADKGDWLFEQRRDRQLDERRDRQLEEMADEL